MIKVIPQRCYEDRTRELMTGPVTLQKALPQYKIEPSMKQK
jgi:hypothetical protein